MESLIIEKYQALPDNLRKEVLDFIEFLEIKYRKETTEATSLAQKRASLFGNAKGQMIMTSNFDDLPEGFEEYSQWLISLIRRLSSGMLRVTAS